MHHKHTHMRTHLNAHAFGKKLEAVKLRNGEIVKRYDSEIKDFC